MSKIIAILFIIFWLLSSIYFGTGGLNYVNRHQPNVTKINDTTQVILNGKYYKNRYELDCKQEDEISSKIYPLLEPLPTSLLYLVTIFSFGLLGSITNIFKQIAIDNKKIENTKYVSEPILGMLTGLIIMGLSFLIPNTLATQEIELKPQSLLFLSLFSGFFSLKFYEYLNKNFGKIFKD